jgi:hypothetical protein
MNNNDVYRWYALIIPPLFRILKNPIVYPGKHQESQRRTIATHKKLYPIE